MTYTTANDRGNTYYRRQVKNGYKTTVKKVHFTPTPVEELAVDYDIEFPQRAKVPAKWAHYIPLVEKMRPGSSVRVYSFAEAMSVKKCIKNLYANSTAKARGEIDTRGNKTGTFRVWRDPIQGD
jgi:hypothetical protein